MSKIEKIIIRSSISTELKNQWLRKQKQSRTRSQAIAQNSSTRVQELDLLILKLKGNR